MTFNFFRTIIFFTLMLPQMVTAFDDCGLGFTTVDGLFDFYKTKCSNMSGESLCTCLREQSEENAFIKTQFQVREDMEEDREIYREKQTQKLMGVYKDMTYGASFQKHIFGIKTPVVGCPADMLKTYYKEAVTFYTKDKIKKEAETKKEKFDNCSTPEECANAKAKEKVLNVSQFVTSTVNNSCNAFSNILARITPGQIEKLVKDLNHVLEWYKSQHAPQKKLNEIQNAINFLNAVGNKSKNKKPEYFVNNIGSLKNESTETCGADPIAVSYESVMTAYNKDSKKSRDSTDRRFTHPDPSSKLVESIKTFNSVAEENFKTKFEEVGPKSCYTYSEYRVIKSMPSKFLIDTVAGMDENHMANYFTPSMDLTSQIEIEKLNYLRSNPAIANTLPVSCARNDFPRIFNKFAKTAAKLSGRDQMRAYIDFMQSDVKVLLKEEEVGVGEANNCKTLAENIAAVYLTDEPAPVTPFSTSNPMDLLSQQILTCKTAAARKLSVGDVDHTLKTNLLYLIQKDKDSVITDEEADEEYQKFLSENCGDFSEFRDGDIKISCTDKAEFEACKAKYSKASETIKLRENYWKRPGSSSLNLTEATDLHVDGHSLNQIDGANFENVTTINKTEAQDVKIQEIYKTQVEPHRKPTVLAERGHEDSFTRDVKSNQAVVAKAASSMYTKSTVAGSPVVASTVAPVVSSSTPVTNVTVPDWSQNILPTVTPSVLATTQPQNHLPANYPAQVPSKKLETLESAKENVVVEGQKLAVNASTASEKDKILSDLKKSIDNMDKEIEKVQDLAKKSDFVPVATGNVVSATSPGPVTSPGNAPTGGSGNFSGPVPGISQAGSFKTTGPTPQEKVSEALLKSKYAQDDKKILQDRSPASVPSEGMNIVVGSTMSKPVPSDSQLLSQLAMDASNFEKADLILEKVKAELTKNKVEKSENVLIQFFDKEKNEVLIVNVSWLNNQWVISPVPRKALLSNLKLTLIDQVKQ